MTAAGLRSFYVIGQWVADASQRTLKPLLAPLPLAGMVLPADGPHTARGHATLLVEDKAGGAGARLRSGV